MLLRALRSRNYRLYFTGQAVSLTGSWMTRIATSWLVYRLTGSAWMLGVVGFAGQIPNFVLGPLGGVLVDRWNRHRTIVVTQILAMGQSLALAYLALTGTIAVWHIIVLSLLQGLINAVDMPARQSFLIELVHGKEDLGNAIALNSSIFNVARLAGPSIAGLVIAAAGEGWCFLIDGLSYLAVIAALLAMRWPWRRAAPVVHPPIARQLREGLGYAARTAPIRSILLLVMTVSFLGMPYAVLMPMVAKVQLHGGPHTYGFLMGAAGLGALMGAMVLAMRPRAHGLEEVIMAAAGLFGVCLMAFAYSRVAWLSLLLMVPVGFALLTQTASCNTVLQTIVADDKRGRVMSLYTTAFLGMTPFGSLLAGSLAGRLGAPATLALGGAVCAASAVAFARARPAIRQAMAA